VLIEVVADDAVVDDQDRPHVVAVRWVCVVSHLRVEHLDHAGHIGPPRTHVTHHAKNVQDVRRTVVGELVDDR